MSGRAGAVPGKKRVPGKFREGSGKVPGTVPGRTGSDGFRGSRVPRFREPVPMGSEVWIDSRVPRFQEPVPMVPGTCYDGFRGLDRFQGSEVRELVLGAIRWVALGSVPEVWTEPVLTGFREPKVLYKKVPDSGDSVPKVPKVALYFESILLHSGCILLYFERALLYTLKVYFCTLKGHFCIL